VLVRVAGKSSRSGSRVALRLHYPFWDRATTCDPDQWLIADVTFDPLRAPSRNTIVTARSSSR
jgi:hypothetical protein